MPQSSHQFDLRRKEWHRYRTDFRNEARSVGRDEEFVDRCLRYSRRLAKQGLPIAFDELHLSTLVGVDFDYLLRCSNAPARFYRSFEIAKRSGLRRTISAPLPTLKMVQRWILSEILAKPLVSRYAHAYLLGASIKTNSRFHLKQGVLVLLDIKDFFPSIGVAKVNRVFRELGYSRSVSALLTGLTTLNGGLPQGAPTSPSLSNLVCRQIDARLGGFCMSQKWRFTRYADDLAFSGNIDVPRIISFVRRVLSDYGFSLRDEKTRVLRRHQRQTVTGVVVNDGPRANRGFRRELRQSAHYIARHGLADRMAHNEIAFANYRAHLIGKARHAQFLNPADRDAAALIKVLEG
jgi:RNA-directed DNA polymerase